MDKTLFEKIIDREIPASIVYETDNVLAFEDVNPQAPVHVLVIPKKPIPKLSDADIDDQSLLGELLMSVNIIAKQLNLNNDGYRVVINNGENACQTVFHLHLHIMGGRGFSWPPG
tara:strand:+ start:1911 stop:2255 length:345 start_codon:yes stop_codon:yes gene_type:complete